MTVEGKVTDAPEREPPLFVESTVEFWVKTPFEREIVCPIERTAPAICTLDGLDTDNALENVVTDPEALPSVNVPVFPNEVVPVIADPIEPESLKAIFTAPDVVTLAAEILPPIVELDANEAFSPDMLSPPVSVVAGNATGLVAVDEMVRESAVLAVPRALIGPAKVTVPEVPAFSVRLKAPDVVAVPVEKAMFAPAGEAPAFVVSMMMLAARVTFEFKNVTAPPFVVMLLFSVVVIGEPPLPWNWIPMPVPVIEITCPLCWVMLVAAQRTTLELAALIVAAGIV